MKYKKIPNNKNAIEVDGKVVLSFDLKYKEYLKWKDENPNLEKKLIEDLEEKIKNNKLYQNGAVHKDGNIWKWYHDNGNLKLVAEMKNDVYNGEVKQYYINGKLKSIENFVEGIKSGYYCYYREHGEKSTEGYYKSGQEHGKKTSYGDYQTKSSEENVIISEENFIFGIPSGPQKYFYPNGKLAREGLYKDNLPVGTETWYGVNGLKMKEKQYVNKMLYKTSHWNPQGIKISSLKYNNELLNGKSVWWYGNGNKKQERTYIDGKLDGKYIDYFVNGNIRSRGNMRSMMMDGRWTFWYHNGQKELECEFDWGKLVGKSKIYHDNGKLKQEVNND